MLWISIDRTSSLPLIRQIYTGLRDRILTGQLPAGQKLPSTRELAAHLNVSRNIVLEAYDQLLAEGYLESRSRSGTYVAQGAHWQMKMPPSPLDAASSPCLSPPSPSVIDFRSGIPALDAFPRKLWSQLTRQALESAPPGALSYGPPEGLAVLREAIADYLLRTRGVVCHADHIIITCGATQAYSLVARSLTTDGDTIILEDPTPVELREIFSGFKLRLHSIPVDRAGLQTKHLPQMLQPRFTLITPSHQFPMGGVMTIQRRIELLNYAHQTHSYVLEDDYDSEFRYEGTPVSSLQGMEPDRVIYVGTFSKILIPALRLGYVVLPSALVERGRYFKHLSDLHSSTLDQLTLATFIQDGYLERHIARMKKLYRQRRDVLRQSLHDRFGDRVTILGDGTGIHLIAEFPDVEFSPPLVEHILKAGVRLYPVSTYALHPQNHRHQVVLGYGNVSTANIEIGVQHLRDALS